MRKLMWFSVGFGLASLAGAYLFDITFCFLAAGVCAVLLAVCLLFLLRYDKSRIAAVALVGCILGFLWQIGYDSYYLSVPRAADGMKSEFTIYATDYSEKTEYGAEVDGYLLLNEKPYKIKVFLPDTLSAAPGDCLQGYFTLKCTLPSCSADSRYDRSDGTFLVAYPLIHNQVKPADQLPFYGFPALVRRYITDMFRTVFPQDVMGFAKALLLGDGSDIDYATDSAFKISGIRHIIAVSGLHVTILFSVFYFLSGKRTWLAALIGIPVMLVFAAITGFSPSITRACIMHTLMALSMLMRREYDGPTALSFAVLVMLIINPWVVCSISFQLSVGCMTGILLFTEPIRNWLLDVKRLGRFRGFFGKLSGWFAASVSVSISATLVTTPLCAYYFGMISLVSVLTNFLTLWIISFVFYGILLTCLVGMFSAPAASVIAWIVAWPMRYVLTVSKWMAAFPIAAVYTESPYIVFWLIFSYILLLCFLIFKRKSPLMLVCCSFLCLCISLFASWTEPLQDECRMTVLDVGQGQCILLQSEGKTFLVDCGGDSGTMAADLAAANLLSQGVYRLDGIILTHYDADHAAGVEALLCRVPADYLYLPECIDEAGYAQTLQHYTGGVVQTVSDDVVITYGNSRITLIPSEFGLTDNESGLCILFQTENYDILITGDRNFSGEMELLSSTQLPDLEVLLVGHHGSRYSTSEALLEATRPDVAIISVSADNHFGHPTQEVLDRLEQFGCIVYRTDQNGTVVFRG